MIFRKIPSIDGGETYIDTQSIQLVDDRPKDGVAKVYLSGGVSFTVRGTAKEFMASLGYFVGTNEETT